jgi:hypothetical protein
MKFKGEIFWRGDVGYEAARVGRIFNGRKPDRFPAAVLFAEDEHIVGQLGVYAMRH